jgi:hypothetical protein
MNLQDLRKPLSVSDIDFRVQSINKGGYATILAYKDARVDMNRLDEVCGALNWKRSHLHSNHNCVVSIYDESKGEWVSKEDTGTESFTEAQKGLASDSFKRACVNWGIGRELYDYPVIQVKLKDDEWFLNDKKKDKFGKPKPDATWNLKLKEWVWYSEFKDNEITFLAAKDNNNDLRFKWGTKGMGEPV